MEKQKHFPNSLLISKTITTLYINMKEMRLRDFCMNKVEEKINCFFCSLSHWYTRCSKKKIINLWIGEVLKL